MKQTTKALLALMTMCIFCFGTCSKKDEKAEPQAQKNKEAIIGKWTLLTSAYKITTNGTVTYDETTSYHATSILTVNQDGSFQAIEESDDKKNVDGGTWVIFDEDENTILVSPKMVDMDSFTIVTLKDGTLTLHGVRSNGTTTVEITLNYKR